MSVEAREDELIDLRCPVGPKALLGRVVAAGEPVVRTEWNLIELHCRDCSRVAKAQDPGVLHVLHRFNIFAELVESVVRRRDTA